MPVVSLSNRQTECLPAGPAAVAIGFQPTQPRLLWRSRHYGGGGLNGVNPARS